MSDLSERFPEMKPISQAPALQSVNGIGTMAYGARDFDPETGTYVKTVWLTLLFVPIVPLGAYRVVDAQGGGGYFLGKVPLSGAAKAWPLVLVLIAAAVGGYFAWQSYTGSPSYKAGQQLAQAERLRQEGKLAEAARLCRQVAEGKTDKSADAMKAITAMLDSPELQQKGDPKEMAGVFQVAWDLRERPGAVPELFERGLRFAEARAEGSPEGSLAVMEAVEPAAPEPAAFRPAKQKILERLTAARPGDVDLLSKLAVVYEQNKQRDRCLALLEPHVKKLGATEGARILGLLYYEKGKHEEAFALLQPYADQRLKALQAVEESYRSALKSEQEQALAQLRDGIAADFDFERAKRLPEAQRTAMVEEYFIKRLKDNAELARQQEALARQMVVVPVALDLGIIRLGRAQGMANAAERKAELEKAEKTFLAVRGLAGDSAEYRISLGQVYYWLGKQTEGRKLFDEVLQADGRKIETILLIANLLRELGASGEARTLLEEAYNQKGADQKKRQEAAAMRAITFKDLDDEILWLDRADSSDPQVKATLAEARGRKAEREGQETEAATHYREAVAVYATQPETSATLNNGGLASLRLYGVTGEPEALKQGVRMLEKALALRPGDGILVSNVASFSLGAALSDLIGDRLDSRKLKRQANVGDLAFLYDDPDGRQALIRRAKESAKLAKARSHLDRALVLAPKRTGLYGFYQKLLHFLGERDGLASLERRAAEANLDLTEARQENRDFLEGKTDEKYRQDFNSAVVRAERTVSETRAGGGATFAVAVASLVRARYGQELMGTPFNADESVRLADEAHRAAPSLGTRITLQTALLTRASQALIAKEPEYAAMAKRVRRSLGDSYLIAVALWREGKPREAALANADVKRALELVLTSFAQFPDESSAWDWAMLRAAHPGDAARIAAELNQNELERLKLALEKRLVPPSTVQALQQCWALDAAGKAEEAREVLKRFAADGVPLPFDVP